MTAVAMPPVGTIGHIEPPWKGDCLVGIQSSEHLGFTAQDINVHATKDLHVVGAHYATLGQNHYHDPTGEYPKTTRIDHLTLAELQRMRPDSGGPQRLDAVTSWMPWAAANGFALCLEAKPDTLLEQSVPWERVKASVDETGCVVVVMAIQAWAAAKPAAGKDARLNHWAAEAKLRIGAAHAAGLPTMLLYRRTVAADWWPILSAVKGGPKPPDGIAHLGNGLPNVTKFGGSVVPGRVKAANERVRKLGGTFPPVVTPSPTPPIVTPPQPPVEVPVPAKPVEASVAKLIRIAKSHVGFREGANNANPFAGEDGFANHQAWCASFVVAVFKEAGLSALITTPSPGVDELAVGFKRAKRWSEYPAVGAVMFHGKASDLDHTGVVVAYDATTITTVEGNTNNDGSREGNGVYLKTRQRAAANVVGYGYPAFVEGIKSADPAWQKKPATKPPVVKPKPTKKPDLTGFKPTIDGVDISHWQGGKLNWAAAAKAGVGFVYHKATEHLSMRDPRYVARRAEVGAAGLPFGGYHFARPKVSGGLAQARFFLSVAKVRRGDLAPMLDLEDRGGLSDEQLTKWVEAFVGEVEKELGKPPILYTNFSLTRDVGCLLWVARYNDANALPKTTAHWSIWQFSNGVNGRPNKVPGLGALDINTLAPGVTVDDLKL